MPPKLDHIKRYLAYRRRSVNRHGVHSPFVYDLIEKVFKPRTARLDYLEDARREFLSNTKLLEIEDLGAGSASGAGSQREVRMVAKQSLSTVRQCRLLANLVEHLNLKNVLEFGSCLGLTAAYMSEAGAEVISMEGSRALQEISVETFFDEGFGPDFRLGAFEDILPGILQEMSRVDMAFIDGNHTEEATLRYFEQLLPHVHDQSVLIFDDIHWSTGMEQAWAIVQQHSRVTLSLDLFWCGMLFFRPGLSGEHFTIRY